MGGAVMCGRPARAPHRCTPLAPPRGRRGGRGGASPVGAPTRPLPRVAVLSVKASGRDGGRGLAQVGTREGVEAGGSAWHPSPDKIRGNDQDRCLWKDLSARRQCTHPQPDWQPPRLSINPQRQGKTRQCQRATSSTIGAPTIAVVTRHCRAPPPACSGGRLAASRAYFRWKEGGCAGGVGHNKESSPRARLARTTVSVGPSASTALSAVNVQAEHGEQQGSRATEIGPRHRWLCSAAEKMKWGCIMHRCLCLAHDHHQPVCPTAVRSDDGRSATAQSPCMQKQCL